VLKLIKEIVHGVRGIKAAAVEAGRERLPLDKITPEQVQELAERAVKSPN
jgi:hypothetical protein